MTPSSTTSNPSSTVENVPWDSLPGEERWYGRFMTFLRLGRQRSLYRTYRIDCRKRGRKPGAYTPGNWKKAAQRFDWHARASAWDDHHTQRVRENLEATYDAALQAAPQAIAVLLELITGEDPSQRRIAANALLKWVARIQERFETPEPDITPIQWIEVRTTETDPLQDPTDPASQAGLRAIPPV